MITLTIPGEPVAKGRPRMTRAGHAYTPAKTRQYEAAVRALALSEIGAIALEGPLSVHIICSYRIPPSWTKARQKRAQDGTEHMITKPDIDNACKAVIDAINGVFWVDDRQIVRLTVDKLYSRIPAVTVTVREL